MAGGSWTILRVHTFGVWVLVLEAFLGLPALSANISANLSECTSTPSGFAWVAAKFRRFRSSCRGSLAHVRSQFGDTAGAEADFLVATQIDPCHTWAHFSLAMLQMKRGDLKAAGSSFEATTVLDPEDGLAYLLYQKVRQQYAQGEFWGLLVAILNEYPQINLTENGQLQLPQDQTTRREIEFQLQRAVGLLEDWAPMRLAMNLDRLSEGHLQGLVQIETEAFKAACDSAVAGGTKYASRLPAALKAVRSLENSTQWLIPWAIERLQLTSSKGRMTALGAYGITWFSAWQQVFQKQIVISSIRQAVDGANVVIIGSALGYQCIFALALGAKHCLGYEIICSTMLTHAREVVAKHKLSKYIHYKCEDAREMGNLDNATLVWVNDETFPEDLRRQLYRKLTRTLRDGTLVVMYHPPLDAPTMGANLAYEETLQVEVSWSYVARLFLLRKITGMPSNLGMNTPDAALPPLPRGRKRRGRGGRGRFDL